MPCSILRPDIFLEMRAIVNGFMEPGMYRTAVIFNSLLALTCDHMLTINLAPLPNITTTFRGNMTLMMQRIPSDSLTRERCRFTTH
jgi:hypothetical protein